MRLIVALCLVAVVVAAPPPSVAYSRDNVQILNYENDAYDNGYKFSFSQTDGQKREEQGELRNQGLENEYYAVKGSYEFESPEGIRYIVTYTADEDGFQPDINEGPGTSAAAVASLLG